MVLRACLIACLLGVTAVSQSTAESQKSDTKASDAAKSAPSKTKPNTAKADDICSSPAVICVDEPKPKPLTKAQRDEMLVRLEKSAHEVIGSGRMTLADIRHVTTWYTVDKNDPDAVTASHDLSLQLSRYRVLSNVLALQLSAVQDQKIEKYFSADLTLALGEAADTLKKVDDQLTELKAMGWDEE